MPFLCHLAICLLLAGSPLPALGSLVTLNTACLYSSPSRGHSLGPCQALGPGHSSCP